VRLVFAACIGGLIIGGLTGYQYGSSKYKDLVHRLDIESVEYAAKREAIEKETKQAVNDLSWIKKDADQKIDNIGRSVEPVRVYIRSACPTVPTDASAGAVVVRESAELDSIARQHYAEHRKQIERTEAALKYCQSYVRTCQKVGICL
jgi:cytosine/adenosine deaminase-related metal-dependent hydrolase